jgi:hypothetical protein
LNTLLLLVAVAVEQPVLVVAVLADLEQQLVLV